MSITLLLAGGLGNQLFQYAAAKALALRHGTALVIDTRFFDTDEDPSKCVRIDEIGIPEPVRPWRGGILGSHGPVMRAWRALTGERRRSFVEPGLGHAAQFAGLPDGTTLIGNYQSPRYFAGYEDRVFADTRCAALVIANSSYSWWAGWFAMQRGAHVYCPRRWIKGLDSAGLAIYPPEWTVIDES